MSVRILQLLIGLLIWQVILAVALYIMYRKHQTELYHRHSDQIVRYLEGPYLEELTLQTIVHNKTAQSVLIYEIIKNRGLKHAKFLSQRALLQTLDSRQWETPCKRGKEHQSFVCVDLVASSRVGFLPIYYDQNLLGYLMQEVSTDPDPDFKKSWVPFEIILTLIVAFLMNLIVLMFYLHRYIGRDLNKLVTFIQQSETNTHINQALPRFKVSEFYRVAQSIVLAWNAFRRAEAGRQDLAVEKKRADMARQLAHDIRSPLTALDVALGTVENLKPTERHLIRSAIDRIRDIAVDFSSEQGKTRSVVESKLPLHPDLSNSVSVPAVIEAMVSEKRLEYKYFPQINITDELSDAYGLFVSMETPILKRVLSNIINNGVEALEGSSGEVKVIAYRRGPWVILSVQDNGRGVPREMLSKICQKDYSFGKQEDELSGLGLGLFHAKTEIEKHGGHITITSRPTTGTTLTMSLPAADRPPWFLTSVRLQDGYHIALIDDDESVHQAWRQRFIDDVESHNVVVDSFLSGEEFKTEREENPWRSYDLYIVDLEFINSPVNGFQFIEENALQHKSILVTSYYEDPAVQSQSIYLGVPLLPKSMIPFVPVENTDRLGENHFVVL